MADKPSQDVGKESKTYRYESVSVVSPQALQTLKEGEQVALEPSVLVDDLSKLGITASSSIGRRALATLKASRAELSFPSIPWCKHSEPSLCRPEERLFKVSFSQMRDVLQFVKLRKFYLSKPDKDYTKTFLSSVTSKGQFVVHADNKEQRCDFETAIRLLEESDKNELVSCTNAALEMTPNKDWPVLSIIKRDQPFVLPVGSMEDSVDLFWRCFFRKQEWVTCVRFCQALSEFVRVELAGLGEDISKEQRMFAVIDLAAELISNADCNRELTLDHTRQLFACFGTPQTPLSSRLIYMHLFFLHTINKTSFVCEPTLWGNWSRLMMQMFKAEPDVDFPTGEAYTLWIPFCEHGADTRPETCLKLSISFACREEIGKRHFVTLDLQMRESEKKGDSKNTHLTWWYKKDDCWFGPCRDLRQILSHLAFVHFAQPRPLPPPVPINLNTRWVKSGFGSIQK